MGLLLFIISLGCLVAAALVLSRSVPAQNIAFIIALLVALEVALEYWNEAGDLQDGAMFWPGTIILLRKGTQVLLKQRRENKNYWMFLLALPCGAAAVLQFLIYPESALMAVGRFCLTAVCLTFLTPWFLQKRITTSGGSKE